MPPLNSICEETLAEHKWEKVPHCGQSNCPRKVWECKFCKRRLS